MSIAGVQDAGADSSDAALALGERPLRADARRNRERILRAAGEVLAERGIDAPIDEIARRAEVGVGTVYRNFPTKEALVEALILARVRLLIVAAREAAHADDPGEAFVGFVRRLSEEFADSKALTDSVAAMGVDCAAAKRALSTELIEAVGALLVRAQKAGRVRPDVTINDVSAMMAGLMKVEPALMDASQRSRCVALMCDSLLVAARSLLPRRRA